MTKVATKKTPKNLASFRAEFDLDVKIPLKIKVGFASLLAEGREEWEYEQDFAKRCGVGLHLLSQYRQQFESHIVMTRADGHNAKRVYFADPKVAKKARGD